VPEYMMQASITHPQSRTYRSVVGTVLVSCFSVLFMFLLHPRLGIRDVDGYAYIMGARSLHQKNGYRSLTSEAFNHWPPGYSLLLSVFPDPLPVALILNYLSFGAATGLLYYLLRRHGWTWQAGLGVSVTFASGFFRLLANQAHADMLTYALFLAAICFTVQGPGRTLPAVIWAFLVPVKLIAVVFLPPAFAADSIGRRQDWKKLLRSYIPAVIVTATGIGSVLAFNILTVGTWIPSSHDKSSLKVLALGVKSLIISIPRAFLFNWHGPVSDPFPRIAFPVCMLLAAICLSSLRSKPDGKWLRIYGASCLVCSGLLLCVRSYDPSARLVGYGLIILMMGFRPMKWANGVWMLYGLVSLVTGVENGMSVNSLGSNDPRYAELAAQFRSYYVGSEIVATNSFHILDLHANIPSIPVEDYPDAAHYQKFFWVTLPNFGAVGNSVIEMPHPGKEWCEERKFSGGVLFKYCSGSTGGP
jgi:hypothetical protein